MADHRATKSGFAREAQEKMASKWDPVRAQEAMLWISQTLGDPSLQSDGTMDDVHAKLMDGLVLAKMANHVKPGSVPASKLSKAPTMAFKRMELINAFLIAVDEGPQSLIKKSDSFQTVDLYERQNLVQVITGIEAVGRALQTQGRGGYGLRESKGDHKEWTEEQLKAGQNIIGLQMGSNKGATQAGQNFGKGRMIVD